MTNSLFNSLRNNNSINSNTSLPSLKRLELKKLPTIEESLKVLLGKYYIPPNYDYKKIFTLKLW